jgi:predicted dehydrogenase
MFNMVSDQISICALGLSDYLRRRALRGVMQADGCNLRAIAVRDPQKAAEALGDTSVPLIASYEAALARDDVDAVYVMLPNAMHFEWVMRSIEAGKHVLCEKPMALSVGDVTTIAQAADANGVKVMEGYMYRFHPQWTMLLTLLENGVVGRVKCVIGHYAYLEDEYKAARFGVGSGGGALRLVGCYLVGAARLAFSGEPRYAAARMRYHLLGEVDQTFSGVLEFAEGHAVLHASVETFDTQYLRVMGDAGMIEMRMPWNPAASDITTITVSNPHGAEEFPVRPADQFQLEFEHFSRMVRGVERPRLPLSETLGNTAAVETLFESALQGGRALSVA